MVPPLLNTCPLAGLSTGSEHVLRQSVPLAFSYTRGVFCLFH